MTSVPESQPSSSQPGPLPEVVLARWSTRFWAWLVDFIVVNAALGVLFGILSAPMWLWGLANPRMMAVPMYGPAWWNGFGPISFATSSLVFFLYWTLMESRFSGQSIGKMLLHIKTTDLAGKQADMAIIAISSFGKAFLLPLDVLLGWIFTNDKRQRLLSRAAGTIVIKTDETKAEDNLKYQRD